MWKRALGSAVAAAAVAGVAADIDAHVDALPPPADVRCANPSRFPRDEHPSVSPDGTGIAFVRTFVSGQPGDDNDPSFVVVKAVSGRNERVLGRGESAAWSPDARELAIVRNSGASYELLTVAIDGSPMRTLSSGPGRVFGVSWSPTGGQLLLLHQAPGSPPRLATVGREGGALTRLVPQMAITEAAWSPDGTLIAVVESRASGRVFVDAIHLLRTDGRLLRSVPIEGASPSVDGVAWSPDGTHLVYSSEDQPQQGYYLFVATADGRSVTSLPDTQGFGTKAAWSPNGAWLVYDFADEGVAQLYLIRPDGTGRHPLPALGRTADTVPPYGFLRREPVWTSPSTLVFTAYRPGGAYRRNFELHAISIGGRNERRLTYHCQFGSPSADRAVTGTYLADVLRAREGADRIDPGPGRDVVDAGAGADMVFLNDGERDIADCGTGADTAVADTRDIVRGCERVSRGPRRVLLGR